MQYINSFVFLLFPLMYLSRFLKKKSVGTDPLDELKINHYMNLIFKIILSIEILIAKSGINFPVGGSLIAVAIKP